jgi:hypothetical protein
MSFQYAYIRDRIESFRPDLKGRQGQLAYQVSARRLADETLGLQEEVIFIAPANSISTEIYTPDVDWKVAIYIFKAEYQKPDGSYKPLPLFNQDALTDLYRHTHENSGTMAAYTTVQGQFWPNRPPAVDTQIRAIVAYKPIGDFDEVDFGPDYEDALVEGALSHLLRIPGHDQDKRGAQDSEMRFLSMASSLRGINLIGDAGYFRASEKPRKHHFGGPMRQNMLRY